jgi:hypothetical protein
MPRSRREGNKVDCGGTRDGCSMTWLGQVGPAIKVFEAYDVLHGNLLFMHQSQAARDSIGQCSSSVTPEEASAEEMPASAHFTLRLGIMDTVSDSLQRA